MKADTKFAICIFAEKDTLLTPRKIYQVLTDERAERSDYIRVIDDEGEDYLYPKKYFVFVPFSRDVERALLQAANA
jgi:hypothetical protein